MRGVSHTTLENHRCFILGRKLRSGHHVNIYSTLDWARTGAGHPATHARAPAGLGVRFLD